MPFPKPPIAAKFTSRSAKAAREQRQPNFILHKLWFAYLEAERSRRDRKVLKCLPEYLLCDLGLTRDGQRRPRS